ncbi:hypothetical protein [Mucilaginibacter sp. OK283]|uniref:hypothetical protein n=1 Tax=Mucilaginibacter sp. OK283 TaxID=1881049 RepID=UPI0008C337F4|nr:hypothetical protein [Mucilaginibacter sp. OK283]SEO20331.1 hypothetical protein SAMN05428947_101693 [Mucilaginibacter sp. OK283]
MKDTDMDQWIILREYASSCLNDEATPSILAWIERTGVTNEEEIVEETGLKKHELSQILLRLYQNRYIVFGKNSLYSTDKGKDFISSLGIEKDIINDMVDNFYFEDDIKNYLIDLLIFSRSHIYSHYLRTANDLRNWIVLSEHINHDPVQNIKHRKDFQIGALCYFHTLFFIIDADPFIKKTFSHWSSHKNEVYLLQSISELFENKKSVTKDNGDILNSVKRWMSNQLVISHKKPYDYKHIDKWSHFDVYSTYSNIRYSIDNDTWNNLWFDNDRSKDKLERLSSISQVISRNYSHGSGSLHFFKKLIERHSLSAESLSVLIDFKQLLETISNYNEFISRFGLNANNADVILSEIASHIDRIRQSKEKK